MIRNENRIERGQYSPITDIAFVPNSRRCWSMPRMCAANSRRRRTMPRIVCCYESDGRCRQLSSMSRQRRCMSPSSYFTAVDAVIVMSISSGDDDVHQRWWSIEYDTAMNGWEEEDVISSGDDDDDVRRRWWFIKLIHRMRYDHNGWEWEEEDVMCWSCFEIWRSDRSNDDVLLGGEGWRRGQLLIEQMQLTYYGLTSNSGMGTNVGATDDGRQLLCCRHYYDDVMTMMVV